MRVRCEVRRTTQHLAGVTRRARVLERTLRRACDSVAMCAACARRMHGVRGASAPRQRYVHVVRLRQIWRRVR
eukprot:10883330-Lingulodinium_polyedra.AAC.1